MRPDQEKQAAADEARAAVASRPGTSETSAREAALRRYLGAETCHEQRREDRDGEGEGDERGDRPDRG